jgi:FkbM family methyltransferase
MGLRRMLRGWEDGRLLSSLSAEIVAKSRAQLHQDLWVLAETKQKRGGFFVEIGAYDGIEHSNTCLLEKEFGWTGILVEPNPKFHDVLRAQRSAALSTKAVYSRNGTVDFVSVREGAALSGIAGHAFDDRHADVRRNDSNVVPVEAITLNGLLREHAAPPVIDYLSIDTEGSEYEILRAFDFDAFDVRLLSVEHNRTPSETKVESLMRKQRYKRVFRRASRFDAWYRRTN